MGTQKKVTMNLCFIHNTQKNMKNFFLFCFAPEEIYCSRKKMSSFFQTKFLCVKLLLSSIYPVHGYNMRSFSLSYLYSLCRWAKSRPKRQKAKYCAHILRQPYFVCSAVFGMLFIVLECAFPQVVAFRKKYIRKMIRRRKKRRPFTERPKNTIETNALNFLSSHFHGIGSETPPGNIARGRLMRKQSKNYGD